MGGKTYKAKKTVILGQVKYTFNMPVADFLLFPAHHLQRPTEKHAAKALKEHFSTAHTRHNEVALGCVLDGPVCMVDGHSRASAWKNGTLTQPEILEVTLYINETQKELDKLYETFDSPFQVKGAAENFAGCIQSLGLEFKSSALRVSFYHAIKNHKNMNSPRYPDRIHEALESSIPELRILDEAGMERFPAWLTGELKTGAYIRAGMASIDRWHEKAGAFWKDVASGKTYDEEKKASTAAGVARAIFASESSSNTACTEDMASKLLGCAQAYIKYGNAAIYKDGKVPKAVKIGEFQVRTKHLRSKAISKAKAKAKGKTRKARAKVAVVNATA